MHELQIREGQFNSVQERGEAMVLDRHPAAASIEVGFCFSTTFDYWYFILQGIVTLSLEMHNLATI